MGKVSMNWNGYDSNIRTSFRKLREELRLFDVTLVTDDGKHIQAHKVILSAGSNFFSDIFMKSNNGNMLVYLKGISSDKLEPVINFIYNGEVVITQEQLGVFIEMGKELKVKGIEDELTGISENIAGNQMSIDESEQKYDSYEDSKVVTNLSDDTEGSAAEMDEGYIQQKTNNEISVQINKMIEKNEGMWKCNICAQTSKTKQNMQIHAEKHIEGISSACHICNRIFTTRHSLNGHMSGIHSELLSCDICGKTGMNRASYRMHNLRHHK